MLSRKFGYITPGEMYYDYYKSDTLRIITVLVTFFVAIPLLAVFLGNRFLVNILSDGYSGCGLFQQLYYFMLQGSF